ncbi:MAG: hypothetical protein JZU65_17375 [Chlorobium sp.]|nr:hypothetical protein [Chlorobium sp.]
MSPSVLKATLRENAEHLVELIWGKLKKVAIETVENSDGRSKEAHETCKNGSFIYLLSVLSG